MSPSAPEPIRTAVEVAADPQTAFDVFVDRIGSWWPAEHSIGAEPKVTSYMERGVGGRLVEVGVDGSECQWGTVLEWEPGRRLVISWQINVNWQPEPDPARASEYTVTFTELAPDRTRVEVVHEHLERHGDGWEGMDAAVRSPDGWPLVLERYRQAVS